MKFLLICQSQDGSFVNIINDAVKNNGGKLTIVTGKVSNIDNDVEIIKSQKYDSVSLKSRLKTWLKFIRDAKRYLKNNIDKYDAVMFTSNPPINQSLVRFVQKKKKKCIYLVWDIYPDTIEKVLGNKSKLVTFFWRKRNHFVYKKCDAVLTIGEQMKKRLLKSYPDVPVFVIPYHADTEFIRPIDKSENIFAKEHNLNDKKVFMYSGKMGAGHGFSEILDAAELLKDKKDIKFVLIGFGSSFETVKKEVEEKKLSNVLMLPYQPFEMLPYTLGCADVSFVTIKEETDGLFLPSKVYDAMASGSAIICVSGGNNDVAEFTEREGVGVNVKIGDVEGLKKTILQFAEDEVKLAECQKRARNLAVCEHSIDKITNSYAKLFENKL